LWVQEVDARAYIAKEFSRRQMRIHNHNARQLTLAYQAAAHALDALAELDHPELMERAMRQDMSLFPLEAKMATHTPPGTYSDS
jgi:hypothetical protein